MLHEVGIQFPCVMSAYPRIRVSMFSTAYPRIRVSTSQYSLKFTWGGVVLSTAYPRIQPFRRCSFKMAGYSAVKPKNLMATCSFYRDIVLSVCLRIRRDTAKCMFSSFPVFRITNGAFSGIWRFIALCRDRQYAQ